MVKDLVAGVFNDVDARKAVDYLVGEAIRLNKGRIFSSVKPDRRQDITQSIAEKMLKALRSIDKNNMMGLDESFSGTAHNLSSQVLSRFHRPKKDAMSFAVPEIDNVADLDPVALVHKIDDAVSNKMYADRQSPLVKEMLRLREEGFTVAEIAALVNQREGRTTYLLNKHIAARGSKDVA